MISYYILRLLQAVIALMLVSANCFAECGPNCPQGCECGCATGECPADCSCGCACPATMVGANENLYGDLNCSYDDCDSGDYSVWGEWFPDQPVLFRQFMADPRALIYSVAWRFNDSALFKNIIPVSYYDTCALYKWYNVWPWQGVLQFEIEGCLWAVFEPLAPSSPLVNADYYVGFPFTYAIGPWAFRLRGYHISSHIGDEFLLQHPRFCRKNPSAEYVDFFISWDYTDEIRLYSGIGAVVANDVSFRQKRFYAEIGAEIRMMKLGFVDCRQRVYGAPIFGMHFRHKQHYGNSVDSTFILGYEFGKLTGEYKRLRLFFEYHDGFSSEGQFARLKSKYFAIKLTYGY